MIQRFNNLILLPEWAPAHEISSQPASRPPQYSHSYGKRDHNFAYYSFNNSRWTHSHLKLHTIIIYFYQIWFIRTRWHIVSDKTIKSIIIYWLYCQKKLILQFRCRIRKQLIAIERSQATFYNRIGWRKI